MYEQFFGLEEEPFRLTPDPRYLFLSPKHAEALAHLKLCLSESSGFVCITGDVGTGKTTLLRVFLSELGPNVASAYTFVPPLSALELLRRICREFKLPVADQSQGDLVDQLHAYLIAQHEAGRLCVLILDEAQALSIDLLEQIRLLLNLETETQKLLRIVLVGQPQLRKLLLDPDLAQLNQRITLRWHLGPLSSGQTATYVSHRLTVASGGRATRLFTRPALRLLHSISGGVPRLINMVAHRALLAAFVVRQPRVNRRMIAQAYHEIQAVPLPGTLSPTRKAALAAAGLAVGVGLVALGAPRLDWLELPLSAAMRQPAPTRAPVSVDVSAVEQVKPPVVDDSPRVQPDVAPARADTRLIEEVAVRSAASPPKAPPAISPAELRGRLMDADAQVSAHAATEGILAAWGERPLGADESRVPNEIESVAWRRGLQEVGLTGNRSMLRLLDLPAVLALRVPGLIVPRYVALIGMDSLRLVLSIDGVAVTIEADALEPFWSGQARVLWRDFDGVGPAVARGARGVGVVRVQQLLQRVGALHGDPTGIFDAGTEAAVVGFQRAHQLEPDGLVGPLTRIVLYKVVGGYLRPTLRLRSEGPA
jgi:general secretion pathway protein A